MMSQAEDSDLLIRVLIEYIIERMIRYNNLSVNYVELFKNI